MIVLAVVVVVMDGVVMGGGVVVGGVVGGGVIVISVVVDDGRPFVMTLIVSDFNSVYSRVDAFSNDYDIYRDIHIC